MNEHDIDPSFAARITLLEAVLRHVPFEGWTSKALRQAVTDIDLPDGAEDIYFPGGPLEVIRFWSAQCDNQAGDHLAGLDLAGMKIRDKVTEGVWARLSAVASREEAGRRAMARLSLPDAMGEGPKQLWASADMIWRAIGDTSTDGNYYSKRTILSGVIGSSLMSYLADQSSDKRRARAFLDARIANVMQFEKAKWEFRKRSEVWPKPAEMLGRLRYGTRRRRRRRS